MKITGVGIDLALVSRFKDKADLAKRILSPNEFSLYKKSHSPDAYLASRFAVKESYVKASNDKTIDYRAIEVQDDSTGKPHLLIDGKEINAFISITHEEEAGAIVILYEMEK